jgi:hypothetical protein
VWFTIDNLRLMPKNVSKITKKSHKGCIAYLLFETKFEVEQKQKC